jgi:hypothetical protein
MTEPIRWSSSDSEVDSVVRSTLRYARDFAPNHFETQALLRRLGDEKTHRSQFTNPLRSKRYSRPNALRNLLVAAFVIFGFGGLAWAAYVTVHARPNVPKATDIRNVRNQTEKSIDTHRSTIATPFPLVSSPVPKRARLLPNATTESPTPKTTTTQSASNSATTSTTNRTEASAEDEANLLRQARVALAGSPYRTLLLLQTHAKRFPQSELAEERAELKVEALHHLGRIAEAKGAQTAFEARFPNSPYRRRLRALME